MSARTTQNIFGHGFVYQFYRADGWYPVQLGDDLAAIKDVENNPGTIKVVNMQTGKTIYENKTADVARPQG